MRIKLGSFRPELLFALLGRLMLIVLLGEVLVMFAYRWFGFDVLSGTMTALLDGVMLTALSAPLIYFWIVLPMLRERRRADDALHLLATVARNSHETIVMTDRGASFECIRPGCSPTGDGAENAAPGHKRC